MFKPLGIILPPILNPIKKESIPAVNPQREILIKPKKKAISKKKFDDKNICKYLILNAIRTLENPAYREKITAICNNN